jgi:hypothetical protein
MSSDGYVTETREVSGFDRVTLKEFGKLIIQQGKEEALSIETHYDLMPKILSDVQNGELILGLKGGVLDKFTDFLSTSLSGHRITFHLTVKELRALRVSGAASVDLQILQTDKIAFLLSGAGSIDSDGLNAEFVEVRLSGTGKIELRGEAEAQQVLISGAGGYIARKLKTNEARIKLSGAGKAIVWAEEDLDVTISGIGSVDYYGEPELQLDITGLGNVVGLGEPKSSGR